MISIVSLMTLKTPIAASKDETVLDLSLGLGYLVPAGAGLAILWYGGGWGIENGQGVPPVKRFCGLPYRK